MNYESEVARNAYEFFSKIRDAIRHEGMNGKRHGAITQRLSVITLEIKKGGNAELREVRSMGLALIQRQRIM